MCSSAPMHHVHGLDEATAIGGLGIAALLALSESTTSWIVAVLLTAGAGYTAWLGIVIARLAPGRLVLPLTACTTGP